MGSETMPESDALSRTLVVACGALARELIELTKINGLEAIDIEYLPASYHNSPELIPEAVRQRVVQSKSKYENIYVGYADCGTGGLLDKVCEELQVERLPGAHCYEFFAGSERFAEIQDAEIGTFYLTDYLTRHFDRLVIQALCVFIDRCGITFNHTSNLFALVRMNHKHDFVVSHMCSLWADASRVATDLPVNLRTVKQGVKPIRSL